MNTDQIKALDDEYVLHTYTRASFVLERGEGTRVYDTEGKAYLDFVGGIAVDALGHGDPDVLEAIRQQSARLVHVSNLYHTAPQAQLAQMLVENSFADKVFFCNSGTESVEAAIKFARKWARAVHGPDKVEFIAFTGAFHGRTMGALALTPRPHYQDPFRPLMPGVKLGTFNDLASAEILMNERTCACIVEPLQGEGGVNPADVGFLQGLRELCDRRGILLIFDEVQCGLGRAGTLWAHEPHGVTPDLMTLAKPLGGGLPIGATLMTQAVADTIEPGDHASTFAANPVICAAAQVVFSKISDPAFLERVRETSSYLEDRLRELQAKYDCIQQIRGRGMIWGIATNADVGPLVDACYEKGLLTCKAGPQVLRLLPPLIVKKGEIDEAVEIIDDAFAHAPLTVEATQSPAKTNGFVVRRAVVKDVPAMARIINDFAAQGQMLPRSRHQLFQCVRDFVVATSGGAVVGCSALHVVWGDLGEIRSLAVMKDWQGKGAGQLIVKTLLDEARTLELPRVFALTYQQGFFERLGFRVVSRDSLPHKIWGDCLDCPKFPNCDEIAVMLELDTKEKSNEKG